MNRKLLPIVGAILLLAGGWIWFANPEFERNKEVLKVGELSATVKQSESLPGWAGPGLLIVGGVLLAAGLLGKR